MKKTWRLIESEPSGAYENMAIDEAIAIHVKEGISPPTVRFYSWQSPSVTIGCFQKISDINTGRCEELAVPVVRRPTGGRALLHCSEITYSFSAPSSENVGFTSLMKSYSAISDVFVNAFKVLDLDVRVRRQRVKGTVLVRSPHCFDSVSLGELVLNGRKIIGSAQKRYRTGFLQQGSIPFHTDNHLYHEVFANAGSPIGLSDICQHMDETDLIASIKRAFENVFNIRFHEDQLTMKESLLARNLLHEKYRSHGWTHRR